MYNMELQQQVQQQRGYDGGSSARKYSFRCNQQNRVSSKQIATCQQQQLYCSQTLTDIVDRRNSSVKVNLTEENFPPLPSPSTPDPYIQHHFKEMNEQEERKSTTDVGESYYHHRGLHRGAEAEQTVHKVGNVRHVTIPRLTMGFNQVNYSGGERDKPWALKAPTQFKEAVHSNRGDCRFTPIDQNSYNGSCNSRYTGVDQELKQKMDRLAVGNGRPISAGSFHIDCPSGGQQMPHGFCTGQEQSQQKNYCSIGIQTESSIIRLEEVHPNGCLVQVWSVPTSGSIAYNNTNNNVAHLQQHHHQIQQANQSHLNQIGPCFMHLHYGSSPRHQLEPAGFPQPQPGDNTTAAPSSHEIGVLHQTPGAISHSWKGDLSTTIAGSLHFVGNGTVLNSINNDHHVSSQLQISSSPLNVHFNEHNEIRSIGASPSSLPQGGDPQQIFNDVDSNLALQRVQSRQETNDNDGNKRTVMYDNSNVVDNATVELNTVLNAMQLLKSGIVTSVESEPVTQAPQSNTVLSYSQPEVGISKSGIPPSHYNHHTHRNRGFNRQIHNNATTSDEERKRNTSGELIWRGNLLPKDSAHPIYSEKIFVGGISQRVTKADLLKGFHHFGAYEVSWCALGGDRDKVIQGCAFVTLESKNQVELLIASCRPWVSEMKYWKGQRTWHYNMPVNKRTSVVVEIILWDTFQGKFINNFFSAENNGQELSDRDIDSKNYSIFVGNLHARFSANDLAIFFGGLQFHDVVAVKIGLDKSEYPVGFAKVTFASKESFTRAIKARKMIIETPEFIRYLQVEPFVEGSPCDVCRGLNIKASLFCRNELCFKYYCDKCYGRAHNDSRGKLYCGHRHNNGVDIVMRMRRNKSNPVTDNFAAGSHYSHSQGQY